jgi:DNA repair exonuclease SbcCD ATPase subunit
VVTPGRICFARVFKSGDFWPFSLSRKPAHRCRSCAVFRLTGLACVFTNAKEYVMLQANEIQQRFTHIQQTIKQAEQACQKASDAPAEIRECIDKLSREAQQAQSVMQSSDQARIMQCVDKLEDMGDDAKRISRSLPTMPAEVEAAVTRVHAELSDLKHKLH